MAWLHGLQGVQVMPLAVNSPKSLAQVAAEVTKHGPTDDAQQAAPHGLGEQDEPVPWNSPEHARLLLASWQDALVPVQHAPAHAPAEQDEPTPLNSAGLWHPLAVVRVHPVSQHAPPKAAQGSGVQIVPLPMNIPVAVQFASVLIEQTRLEKLQHAPAQGLGEQVEPNPCAPLPKHAPLAATWQDTPEQHAREQGLVEQDEPTPRNTEKLSHPFWVVAWQPVSEQHAPPMAAHGSGVQVVPLDRNVPELLAQ